MQNKAPERFSMSTPPGETRREEEFEDLMSKLTEEVKAELIAEDLGQSADSSGPAAEEVLVSLATETTNSLKAQANWWKSEAFKEAAEQQQVESPSAATSERQTPKKNKDKKKKKVE